MVARTRRSLPLPGSQTQPIDLLDDTTDEDVPPPTALPVSAETDTPRGQPSSSRPSSSRSQRSPNQSRGSPRVPASSPAIPLPEPIDLTLSSDEQATPRQRRARRPRPTNPSPTKLPRRSLRSSLNLNTTHNATAGPSSSTLTPSSAQPTEIGVPLPTAGPEDTPSRLAKGKAKAKTENVGPGGADPLIGTWGHPLQYVMPKHLQETTASRQTRSVEPDTQSSTDGQPLAASGRGAHGRIRAVNPLQPDSPLGSWGNPQIFELPTGSRRPAMLQDTREEKPRRSRTRLSASHEASQNAGPSRPLQPILLTPQPSQDEARQPGTWGNPIIYEHPRRKPATADVAPGEDFELPSTFSSLLAQREDVRSTREQMDGLSGEAAMPTIPGVEPPRRLTDSELKPVIDNSPAQVSSSINNGEHEQTTLAESQPEQARPAASAPKSPTGTTAHGLPPNRTARPTRTRQSTAHASKPSSAGPSTQTGPRPGEWGNPITFTAPNKRRPSSPDQVPGSPLKKRSLGLDAVISPPINPSASLPIETISSPPKVKRLGPTWATKTRAPTPVPPTSVSEGQASPSAAEDVSQHIERSTSATSAVGTTFNEVHPAPTSKEESAVGQLGSSDIHHNELDCNVVEASASEEPIMPAPTSPGDRPLAQEFEDTEAGADVQRDEDMDVDVDEGFDDSDLDGLSEMGQQDSNTLDVDMDLPPSETSTIAVEQVQVPAQVAVDSMSRVGSAAVLNATASAAEDPAVLEILRALHDSKKGKPVGVEATPPTLEVPAAGDQPAAQGLLSSDPSFSGLSSDTLQSEQKAEEAIEDVREGVADVEIASLPTSRAPSSPPSIEEIAPEAFAAGTAGISHAAEYRNARPPNVTPLEWIRTRVRQRTRSSPALSSDYGSPRSSTPILPQASTCLPSRNSSTYEVYAEPIAITLDDGENQEGQLTRAEWRSIVEDDGASDVEMLLDDSALLSSGALSALPDTIDEHLYPDRLSDPTQQPPDDRRGISKREFNSASIDYYNSHASQFTRNPALHRLIFQAFILEKEVDSGEITVAHRDHQSVDLEGSPPDFEFEYSNDMLYHPDVPDPEKGLGCGCEGPCNPKSRTCTCLKRQQAYFYDLELDGFAYDERGLAKNLSTPIWECGETCDCPPECMNRVIQKGRKRSTQLEIFKTRKKGWGVRARTDIPRGTFIGIYAGELITEEESEARGEMYSEIGRTYLFDLDGWQIRNPPAGLAAIDPRLAETAEAAALRARNIYAEHEEIDLYNAYSVDAFHYGYTRYFNHSCDPNLEITQCYVKDFHPERPLLVIFARRDIRAKEELCISYKGTPDDSVVPSPEQEKKKKGKGRQAKTSASAHVSVKTAIGKTNDANRCYCGAKNCDGRMFNL